MKTWVTITQVDHPLAVDARVAIVTATDVPISFIPARTLIVACNPGTVVDRILTVFTFEAITLTLIVGHLVYAGAVVEAGVVGTLVHVRLTVEAGVSCRAVTPVALTNYTLAGATLTWVETAVVILALALVG